jgi:hypothetical protein
MVAYVGNERESNKLYGLRLLGVVVCGKMRGISFLIELGLDGERTADYLRRLLRVARNIF